MLGQTHHLLGESGDELAQRLVQAAKLTLRRAEPVGGSAGSGEGCARPVGCRSVVSEAVRQGDHRRPVGPMSLGGRPARRRRAGPPPLAGDRVAAPSLDRVVDDSGPLPEPALVTLAHRLAEALAQLHAKCVAPELPGPVREGPVQDWRWRSPPAPFVGQC